MKTTQPAKLPFLVNLRRLYKDKDWGQFKNKPAIPLGADTPTNNLIGNLDNFFDLMVGGKKHSGKSAFLNCAMVNLLKNTNPDKFKFILIDINKKDLLAYKNLPNLLYPVITAPNKAEAALRWCRLELSRRLEIFLDRKMKNIDEYVEYMSLKMPRILIIINGCSDLIKKNPRFYKKMLFELALLGCVTNINLFIITSKVTNEIYPQKLLRLFYRIALATNSRKESKILIGEEGAEKIRVKGRAILKFPQKKEATRPIQCFFISKEEIRKAIATFTKIKG